MASGDAVELGADVAEAQNLLAQATRPAVKAVLEKLIQSQQALIDKAAAAAAEEEQRKQAFIERTTKEIEALEAKKAKAAADEDFEAASSLRDQVAALRAQLEDPQALAAAATTAPEPAPAPAPKRPSARPDVHWQPLDKFSWEQGEYNTPWVNVYVPLDGVGGAKERVTCDFTDNSFDLKVMGLNGANYRLYKDALEKDIIVGDSRFLVKANKVVIKMKKVKGEYSYDNWQSLVPKRKKTSEQKAAEKDNPTAGIMDMMKDMYDEGDEQTKKMIGEAMLKSRSGDKSMPGMPGMD